MENWKNIDGDNRYQVSSFGRVKSYVYLKERVLKAYKNRKGYLTVDIYRNKQRYSIQVHQLVAIAFLNHKPCGMDIIVDHIDGNILNNHLSNLQLTTNGENVRKQRKRPNATSKYVGVSFCKLSNKWKAQIQINKKKKHIGLYKSQLEAINAYQNYKNEQLRLEY